VIVKHCIKIRTLDVFLWCRLSTNSLALRVTLHLWVPKLSIWSQSRTMGKTPCSFSEFDTVDGTNFPTLGVWFFPSTWATHKHVMPVLLKPTAVTIQVSATNPFDPIGDLTVWGAYPRLVLPCWSFLDVLYCWFSVLTYYCFTIINDLLWNKNKGPRAKFWGPMPSND